MGEHYPYIKFLADVIESGTWANLSAAARTLYLVLLKFSDHTFKPVWPSNESLLRLTGLKTKKSINEGKKDLVKAGLLQFIPGTGHKNSMYYFCFNYPGSKIPPQGVIFGNPGGREGSPPGDSRSMSEGGIGGPPNNINITIHNTQNQKPSSEKGKKELSLSSLASDYGDDILEEALLIAKNQGQSENLHYIRGICRNLSEDRKPNFEQNTKVYSNRPTPSDREASWRGFLDWCRGNLSKSSAEALEKLRVEPDGKTLLVLDPVSDALRMIIAKYFTDKIHPSILVIFSAKAEENRVQI
ncbi:helix-turn-helix domain-containing protein [Leptospira wolffii]|uniref:Helix-turn-helix domain-containing protein n=1 Tax=Leptospira wolffii TaxID=409998 RepID=A0A2M9ZCQ7_9LEPT|nr:helix-turn-helix domain-containing protein [Leptospira wolffii]PJZ66107.1 helix-turn-helix domain-containing protein [Leptospira wolffii]TGK59272.1 helix-turn-helix domain-containing protein [Leptospira wolffii]TGK71346.1 helix-turn-helix domain-containing protein [Leptospira wolffii]TGK77913.1 helix-turn-helix domain-containing protein [Leptospira wolffii]TGL29377.1 helix-turn-helix domain-containing protein [Leptospira wolffii]